MDPETKRKFQELENKIKLLERMLLKMPLDPQALGALNQALISGDIEQINIRRVILRKNGATNPIKEGEIIYHDTTPSLKVLLGGVVKTINVS